MSINGEIRLEEIDISELEQIEIIFDGRASKARLERFIDRLIKEGFRFHALLVVRDDDPAMMTEGRRRFLEEGVSAQQNTSN